MYRLSVKSMLCDADPRRDELNYTTSCLNCEFLPTFYSAESNEHIVRTKNESHRQHTEVGMVEFFFVFVIQ